MKKILDKKYKIVITEFNEKTREHESTETLRTKPICEIRLKALIIKKIAGKNNVCWSITPRPKGFYL